jgi:hypothetical protein
MPYIAGQYDTLDGEPTRTYLRWTLLTALRETVPGILPDLRDTCMADARAVLATAEPSTDPYVRAEQHGNLLALPAPGEAARKLEQVEAAVQAGHNDPHLRKLRDRAAARAQLMNGLLEWATGYYLTDPEGRRNRWLLEVALDTLGVWCEDDPDKLEWSGSGGGYWVPFTDEERAVWDPQYETRAAAEARLRAAGRTRASARAAVDGVLAAARERWRRAAQEKARPKVSIKRPRPEQPGPAAEETLPILRARGIPEADVYVLADLMEEGYSLEEARGMWDELQEKNAAVPLPDVTPEDPIRPAPQFRAREHGTPEPGSDLGPLARDFRWLVAYVCTPLRPVQEFAPGVARSTVIQRVRSAAARCGFELPDPLRPEPKE